MPAPRRSRACDSRAVIRTAGKISQMLLKACLNGARLPAEHPALPATPKALARDIGLVAAAGVGAVHFHPKDPAGVDTLEADALAAALVAARSARPAVPLGITTGAWAVADPEERATLVRSWPVLPDFASVNWHEPGAEALTAALLSAGSASKRGSGMRRRSSHGWPHRTAPAASGCFSNCLMVSMTPEAAGVPTRC